MTELQLGLNHRVHCHSCLASVESTETHYSILLSSTGCLSLLASVETSTTFDSRGTQHGLPSDLNYSLLTRHTTASKMTYTRSVYLQGYRPTCRCPINTYSTKLENTQTRYLNLRCRPRNRHATNTHPLYGTAAPCTSPLLSFQTQRKHAVDSFTQYTTTFPY